MFFEANEARFLFAVPGHAAAFQVESVIMCVDLIRMSDKRFRSPANLRLKSLSWC